MTRVVNGTNQIPVDSFGSLDPTDIIFPISTPGGVIKRALPGCRLRMRGKNNKNPALSR